MWGLLSHMLMPLEDEVLEKMGQNEKGPQKKDETAIKIADD